MGGVLSSQGVDGEHIFSERGDGEHIFLEREREIDGSFFYLDSNDIRIKMVK
jgi:hypothetical protein